MKNIRDNARWSFNYLTNLLHSSSATKEQLNVFCVFMVGIRVGNKRIREFNKD